MIDDGYGNFGGGGSVQWEIDVNDGNAATPTPKPGGNPRKYKVKGVDREDVDDTNRYFKVTIENRTSVLMGFEGDDLILAIPIRKNSARQVQVQWVYERAQLPGGLRSVTQPQP